MKADNKYRAFHGRAVRRRQTVDLHVPQTLVRLGRAVAIEYECDKLNGGGDGTQAVYRHEFDKGAVLCMDERARGQLYILGSRIVVTPRGIVH